MKVTLGHSKEETDAQNFGRGDAGAAGEHY